MHPHLSNYAGLAFVLGAAFIFPFAAVIEFRAARAALRSTAQRERQRRERYEPEAANHLTAAATGKQTRQR